jgi:hypothetical protein
MRCDGVAKQLLEAGAVLGAPKARFGNATPKVAINRNALELAVRYSGAAVVEALFAKIAEFGDIDAVLRARSTFEDLHHAVRYIDAMLYLAIARGNADVVELLLKKGAEPNAVLSNDRKTALHIAVEHGRADVCRKLVERGARPDVRKENYEVEVSSSSYDHLPTREWQTGETALELARTEAVKIVLKNSESIRNNFKARANRQLIRRIPGLPQPLSSLILDFL